MLLHAVQFMTHPINRLFYLLAISLSLPGQSKYVNEMDGCGGSINDLILSSRPSILSRVPRLARITLP